MIQKGVARSRATPLQHLCSAQLPYGQALPVIWPVALLKVQVLVPQLLCCAVSWNVFVPTVAMTVTPFVALNPGGVPDDIVPDLYVEFAAK